MTPRLVDQRGGNVLLRGPRPASQEEMAGVRCPTIVNFESGFYDIVHDEVGEEDRWAAANGQRLVHLPLGDVLPPTLCEGLAFLHLVDLALDKGSVFIHCLYGDDRTGFMSALWRVVMQNRTPDDAIAEMIALGFHEFPYFYWIPRLRAVMAEASKVVHRA